MNLDWMTRDSEKLMTLLATKKRKVYPTRADALPAILGLLGFQIQWSDLVPKDVFGFTNFETNQVVLPNDLASRLDFPEVLDFFCNATIAHELGHIRLHAAAARRGERGEKWEDEAYAYSCAFLIPYQDLMSQPEAMLIRGGLIQDQDILWRSVLRLAEFYQVSGAFMIKALQRYGVILFDQELRTIRPCTVLVRKATKTRKILERLAERFGTPPTEKVTRRPFGLQ